MYVEYPELRDMYEIDGIFYGVFTSGLSNEQSHSARKRGGSLKPQLASAICTFTMNDVVKAFRGPFKRKDRVTGGWRAYDPGREGEAITPDPYFCAHDTAVMNHSVKNMTIDFLDPTQPYEEELRHFDMRSRSKRLKFFEEDVYGSRTMWDEVQTTPILAEPNVVFDKIVGHTTRSTTFLYASTLKGAVYKIKSEAKTRRCHTTDPIAFKNWLNSSASMSSIWDNEFYAYMNRTINSVTFEATFKSDLTMEKLTEFPHGALFESDWDCTPDSETEVLAVFKPFEKPTKIWDMKFTHNSLVIASDEAVLQIPVTQCEHYPHCTLCSNDPHCIWTTDMKTPGCVAEDSIFEAKECSCETEERVIDMNDDVILSGFNIPGDTSLVWLYNGTQLEYAPGRTMLSADNSLILFNFLEEDEGLYELREPLTDVCYSSYLLTMSECEDTECLFTKKYREWCREYDNFLTTMNNWVDDYDKLGYCSNLKLSDER